MKARVINGSDNIGAVIKLKYSNGFTIGKTIISNTQIESIELITQENIVTNKGGGKSIVGALGWGTAGGLVFGPLGGLAGLVFGGRKHKISTTETNIFFALYLKDSRKYLINSDLYTFQTIKAMCFAPMQNNIKETNYIKCKYCNSEMSINSNYCTNCGQKL